MGDYGWIPLVTVCTVIAAYVYIQPLIGKQKARARLRRLREYQQRRDEQLAIAAEAQADQMRIYRKAG
jgi:hypothetical protein